MNHFCNFLFKFMKHGTNTLHVVFTFLLNSYFKNNNISTYRYIAICVSHLVSGGFCAYNHKAVTKKHPIWTVVYLPYGKRNKVPSKPQTK